MAPIQPWSACGAENPMVMALPGLSLSVPPVLTLAAWWRRGVAASSLLLVQRGEDGAGAEGAGADQEAAATEGGG